MKFVLRYRGPLPAGGRADVKHKIRQELSKQLAVLWERDPVLCKETSQLSNITSLTIRDRPLWHLRELKGFRFVPLVTEINRLDCQLDIRFLVEIDPKKPNRRTADLDNKLKTLLDALRVPQSPEEVGKATPSSEHEVVYCLLEDDALISRLTVETYQLLEEPSKGDVLHLHVTILPRTPHKDTLHFFG
jgi:hypothetical protein